MLTISTIWRHPVKSIGGEQLDVATAGPNGIEGDRSFGLRDLETGLILTARRQPELLFASARWESGSVAITLPDGTVTDDDAVLSAWLGKSVALTQAGEAGTFENPMNVDTETDWVQWQGPEGSFHDSGRDQISIVSTTTLRSWDARRFRKNLICHGAGEDDLVGSRLIVGEAELEVTKPVTRCVMVTRPQPGGIVKDINVLRTIARERDNTLGIASVVLRCGTIRVGDSLQEM